MIDRKYNTCFIKAFNNLIRYTFICLIFIYLLYNYNIKIILFYLDISEKNHYFNCCFHSTVWKISYYYFNPYGA